MHKINITLAQYSKSPLTGNTACINAVINGITMSVPLDPGNRHYAEILRQVDAGELTIEPDPGPTMEQIAAQVRGERDRLLAETDWTQVADAPVDAQAYADYRQALRDVPQQSGFPGDIDWPSKP